MMLRSNSDKRAVQDSEHWQITNGLMDLEIRSVTIQIVS